MSGIFYMTLVAWYSSTMKKVVILLVFTAAIVGLGYKVLQSVPDPSIQGLPKVTATIDSQKFSLYAPATPEGLQHGLSVFKKIESNEGMIFRGLPVGVQTFWMKDMKFDIDIIWVNKDNQIVHIVYAASKDSYPQRYENPANRPSAYIIELKAGTVDKYSIAPGMAVQISE